jgi:hypothetical protein
MAAISRAKSAAVAQAQAIAAGADMLDIGGGRGRCKTVGNARKYQNSACDRGLHSRGVVDPDLD